MGGHGLGVFERAVVGVIAEFSENPSLIEKHSCFSVLRKRSFAQQLDRYTEKSSDFRFTIQLPNQIKWQQDNRGGLSVGFSEDSAMTPK
jgi:hypothetical protein